MGADTLIDFSFTGNHVCDLVISAANRCFSVKCLVSELVCQSRKRCKEFVGKCNSQSTVHGLPTDCALGGDDAY